MSWNLIQAAYEAGQSADSTVDLPELYPALADMFGTVLGFMAATEDGKLPFFAYAPEKPPETFPWGYIDQVQESEIPMKFLVDADGAGFSIRQDNVHYLRAYFVITPREGQLDLSLQQVLRWERPILMALSNNFTLHGKTRGLFYSRPSWGQIPYAGGRNLGFKIFIAAKLAWRMERKP